MKCNLDTSAISPYLNQSVFCSFCQTCLALRYHTLLIFFKEIKLPVVSITCSGRHPSKPIKRVQYVQYCRLAGGCLLAATGRIKRKVLKWSWFIILNSVQSYLTRSPPPCTVLCLFTQLCVDWETTSKSINFEKHNKAWGDAQPVAILMRGGQAICHLRGH